MTAAIPANPASQPHHATRKRRAAVAELRDRGHGGVKDVADFFGISPRQIRYWLEQKILSHARIGDCIWISAHDIQHLPNCHRPSKYFRLSPEEWRFQVARDFEEFLTQRRREAQFRDDILARLAALEAQLQTSSHPNKP